MERRKRIYPCQKEQKNRVGIALLVLTLMIVLGGLWEKRDSGSFLLEKQQEAAKPQLEEAFDETITEAVIQLPAHSWYALQVGVFEKEETAKQSSEAFRKRGAAGYIWPDGRYRVLAAAYPQKEDAQLVREQLREQHDIDSYIYEISLPAFTLRMQGMQGQLEIFQASAAHIHDVVLALQQLSVRMDRQEISVSEAVQSLNALKEQMEIVVLRMEQRFAKPRHSTVECLSDGLSHFNRFVSELTEDESAVSMGMKLKYQVFAMLADIQRVYDSLDHT